MKEVYRISCQKFSDLVTLENGIIEDCMPLLQKFQGQPISNLTGWAKKVFGNVDVKRIE
jgi:hypothetical protein